MKSVLNIIREGLLYIYCDEKHVRRNTGIQIFFVTLAFIVILGYPVKMQKEYFYSKQKAFDITPHMDFMGEPFGSTDKKLQKVYFSHDHIYQIKLYMNCVTYEYARSEEVIFGLYDENFSCIYTEKCDTDMIEDAGYLIASPDLDVLTDKAYYYEMLVPEEIRAQLFLPTASRSALAQEENSSLFIDGIVNDELCLAADFSYSRVRSVYELFMQCLAAVVAVIAAYIFIMCFLVIYDSRLSEYDFEIKKYFRYAASAVICMAAVFAFVYLVALNKFGGSRLLRLFFAVAVLAGGLWLLALVWLPYLCPKEKKVSSLSAGMQISLIWRNYIQTVSFALLFYALCQYVNADRELYHIVNTRWALIFMAIALLMMYNEKQLLNILSFMWLVISIVGSCFYCGRAGMDENELLVAKLTCGVVIAWGLLLINLLLQLKPRLIMETLRKIKLWQLAYGALWIAFAVLMYIYRFEKTWVFTAVLPFAAALFVRFNEAKRSRFIKNLTNGILLNFGLVTFFCLMHRPYHYWMLYRYGGMFHTVACTGMYLSVVLGAAVARLYGKLWENKGRIVCCCNEFLLVAVVIGYIILTMSRTAFLTSAVTISLVMIINAFTYKKKLKKTLLEAGIILASSMLCFPLVFSAVRIIPSVVADPVTYDLERYDNRTTIGFWDPMDSDKYMTVERFFDMLLGRFEHAQASAGSKASNINIAGSSDLIAYAGKYFKDLGILYFDDSDSSDAAANTDRDKGDISNGRFAIFKDYFSELALGGHPKMSPLDEGGNAKYDHAHNSYLQVAYNFGEIAGGIFIIICIFTLLLSARLVYMKGREYPAYIAPFALVVVFGFISLTEWAFHPCIPAGFCFLMMQPLLMCK